MRLWSCARSSFGVVVMMAKVHIRSRAGDFQFSHRPASAIRPRSPSAIVARWCAGSKVETDGGVFRIRDDEPMPRTGAPPHRTP